MTLGAKTQRFIAVLVHYSAFIPLFVFAPTVQLLALFSISIGLAHIFEIIILTSGLIEI